METAGWAQVETWMDYIMQNFKPVAALGIEFTPTGSLQKHEGCSASRQWET